MGKRLLAALAGAVAIAVVAAGCGSGDDDSTTATLTKAQFIKRGDAICKKGDQEIEDGFESFAEEKNLPDNKEPTKAQLTEAVETIVLPSIQSQSEALRDLPAPSGDEDQVSAMLDAVEEAVEEGEEDPAALISSKADPFNEANELASEYGLKVCGQE